MRHEEKIVVPHAKEEVYNMVAHVDKYPEFIPWCKSAKLLKVEDGYNYYEILVKFGLFSHSFTTKDKFTPYDKIEISLVEGPFKHLESIWSFKSLAQSETEIDFFIDFEFKSVLLNKALGKIFVEANKKIVHSFLERISEAPSL